MLKNLIAACLLATNIATGNATNFEPTKKNTTYTENINLTSTNYTRVAINTAYNDTTFRIEEEKYNILKSTDEAHIFGNLYKTDYMWYIDQTTPQNYDSGRKTNYSLLLLQVNPYTQEESAETTLNFNIELDTGYLYSQYTQIGYSISYFVSENRDLAQLLNMQNWTNQNWKQLVNNILQDPNNEIIGAADQYLMTNDNRIKQIQKTISYSGTSRTFFVGFYIQQISQFTADPTGLQDPPAEGECVLGLPTGTVTIHFQQPINYEVVDIPGMVLQIITMPFTFVSTAFNLTLFPGTPYQVNIANLFMTLFATLVFTFLLKLILGRS